MSTAIPLHINNTDSSDGFDWEWQDRELELNPEDDECDFEDPYQ